MRVPCLGGVFGLLVLATGCGAPSRGALTPAGYQDKKFDLALPAVAPSGALLAEDWKLESHYRSGKDWVAKVGPGWEVNYQFDFNGDGQQDDKDTGPAVDLLWEHRPRWRDLAAHLAHVE
jgi:hypothetical protein